jgi:hypothetical protein
LDWFQSQYSISSNFFVLTMEGNQMNIALFVMWGAVGWCGTPYPGWWRGPRPHPDPEPWLVARIIGIVTGILGGWGYTQMFGGAQEHWTAALPAAASCVGAFAVARIVGEVYGRLAGGKEVAGVG